MVHFVGAGPGAPDLITRRGAALLQEADCIIMRAVWSTRLCWGWRSRSVPYTTALR